MVFAHHDITAIPRHRPRARHRRLLTRLITLTLVPPSIMSKFDKPKLDESEAPSRTLWQTPATSPPALTSTSAAHAQSQSLLAAGHLPDGDGSVDAAAAETALAHWADPPSPKHEGWGLGDAWRGIERTATSAYDSVSGMTDTAGKYLHRAEQGFDHGVDTAENQLQRPPAGSRRRRMTSPVRTERRRATHR